LGLLHDRVRIGVVESVAGLLARARGNERGSTPVAA
jgi:hypothetical protein